MSDMSSDDDREKGRALAKLEEYRAEIDKHDADLMEALGKRIRVVEKIGALKRSNKLDIEDENREKKVRDEWEQLARSNRVSTTLAKDILNKILGHSKEIE